MLLGELLIHKKLLSKAQLDAALEEQKATREFLGSILVKRKFIREEELLGVLSEQFHMPWVRLQPKDVDWDVALRYSSSLVVDHKCMPYRQDDTGVKLALVDPLDAKAMSLAEDQAKGVHVRPALVTRAEMDALLAVYREKMSERIRKLLE
jgi:type IV pilus assembly protein PilB